MNSFILVFNATKYIEFIYLSERESGKVIKIRKSSQQIVFWHITFDGELVLVNKAFTVAMTTRSLCSYMSNVLQINAEKSLDNFWPQLSAQFKIPLTQIIQPNLHPY